MNIFDPYLNGSNGSDEAVLCHEFGHAVAWFTFCGVVGSIKLTRQSNDEGIEGAILLLPRDGKKTTEENESYLEPCAVRLIAGDVAYRKAMGMTEGKISLRGFLPNRDYPLGYIVNKLEQDDRMDDDLYLIIQKAIQAAPDAPIPWISARLQQAIEVVNKHWTDIAVLARRSCAYTPSEDQEVWIPGTTLITWMMNRGIEPGQKPPLEIIDWEDQADRVTSIKRLCRRLCGKHEVLHVKMET